MFGRVAIIWKKEINENIKELIDGGNRIQAIHIQQGDKPICLTNVYMPSDSKNADIEYKDTLAQIDEMIEKYKDTHEIIVCGDMNGSLHRSSTPHDKILQTFCKEKCIGNSKKCPVKETFYHQNGKSKGQIDYFLFKSNSEIINKIRQIDVLDTDPENTSDHVPVILTLNNQLKKVRENATTIIAKPKWTDCDHQIYKEIINKDLPNLMQKSKGIIEQDIRNLEKLLHKAGEAAIPKYRRKIKIKSKGKAIWNEQIDKASKQSKNAYKVWRQHGAPQERSNELKIKMTAAKRILRKAQRQAYASQRESTAGKIMKASNADTKLFYKLINMQRKTPLTNTKILKLNEKTAEDGPSIMNIWQEHFQQLATPTLEENVDTEKLELVEIQNNIIESIEREKGQGIDHVNVKEVNKAIEKLKAGKAPDEDGISAEHYKHGMEELTPLIVHLLNLILTYLDVPIFLKTGILTPILKKEKDKTLPSSYRGITVTKTFAKILQSILKDRVDSVFKKTYKTPCKEALQKEYHHYAQHSSHQKQSQKVRN
ncbi:unnamed protein product [Mytilus coruscus]|uniref:Endonuclease/exonuclease/phosphatase domain-containing protein n=1 Tax=Mytilus coruscus TaxID=42192 RepID=A0A6J8A939_MYTCO|nr:unnamed protein product [Mytilus coruscus]